MFCPKCGNSLPDGAAFCGSCGHAFQEPAKAVAPPAHTAGVHSRAATSNLNLSGTQILAIVFAVVAVVFALMPWIVPSDTLITAGKAGSAISSFMTMGNYSTANFEDAYTMFALTDFLDDLSSYWGSSRSGGSPTLIIMMGAWAGGLILLIVGAILLLLKKSKALLIIGAMVMIALALYYNFYFYAAFVAGGYTNSCANPLICAFACSVALILSIASKKPKAGKV